MFLLNRMTRYYKKTGALVVACCLIIHSFPAFCFAHLFLAPPAGESALIGLAGVPVQHYPVELKKNGKSKRGKKQDSEFTVNGSHGTFHMNPNNPELKSFEDFKGDTLDIIAGGGGGDTKSAILTIQQIQKIFKNQGKDVNIRVFVPNLKRGEENPEGGVFPVKRIFDVWNRKMEPVRNQAQEKPAEHFFYIRRGLKARIELQDEKQKPIMRNGKQVLMETDLSEGKIMDAMLDIGVDLIMFDVARSGNELAEDYCRMNEGKDVMSIVLDVGGDILAQFPKQIRPQADPDKLREKYLEHTIQSPNTDAIALDFAVSLKHKSPPGRVFLAVSALGGDAELTYCLPAYLKEALDENYLLGVLDNHAFFRDGVLPLRVLHEVMALDIKTECSQWHQDEIEHLVSHEARSWVEQCGPFNKALAGWYDEIYGHPKIRGGRRIMHRPLYYPSTVFFDPAAIHRKIKLKHLRDMNKGWIEKDLQFKRFGYVTETTDPGNIGSSAMAYVELIGRRIRADLRQGNVLEADLLGYFKKEKNKQYAVNAQGPYSDSYMVRIAVARELGEEYVQKTGPFLHTLIKHTLQDGKWNFHWKDTFGEPNEFPFVLAQAVEIMGELQYRESRFDIVNINEHIDSIIDRKSEHYNMGREILSDACKKALKQLDPLLPYKIVEGKIARLYKLEGMIKKSRAATNEINKLYTQVTKFIQLDLHRRAELSADWKAKIGMLLDIFAVYKIRDVQDMRELNGASQIWDYAMTAEIFTPEEDIPQDIQDNFDYKWASDKYLQMRIEEIYGIAVFKRNLADMVNEGKNQEEKIHKVILWALCSACNPKVREVKLDQPLLEQAEQKLQKHMETIPDDHIRELLAAALSVFFNRRRGNDEDKRKAEKILENVLTEFFRLAKKAEIHHHISGSISPELGLLLFLFDKKARQQCVSKIKGTKIHVDRVDSEFAKYCGVPEPVFSQVLNGIKHMKYSALRSSENRDRIKELFNTDDTDKGHYWNTAVNNIRKLFVYNEADVRAQRDFHEVLSYSDMLLKQKDTMREVLPIVAEDICMNSYKKDGIVKLELRTLGIREDAEVGMRDTLQAIVTGIQRAEERIEKENEFQQIPKNTDEKQEAGVSNRNSFSGSVVVIFPKESKRVLAGKDKKYSECANNVERLRQSRFSDDDFCAIVMSKFFKLINKIIEERKNDELHGERSVIHEMHKYNLKLQNMIRSKKGEKFRDNLIDKALEYINLIRNIEQQETVKYQVEELISIVSKDKMLAHYVRGIDTAGIEHDFQGGLYRDTYELACSAGLCVTSHIGEVWYKKGPVGALTRIWHEITAGVQRLGMACAVGFDLNYYAQHIAHKKRTHPEMIALKEIQQDIMDYLRFQGQIVEFCPTSNVMLTKGDIKDYASLPGLTSFKAGIRSAVGTDNKVLAGVKGQSEEFARLVLYGDPSLAMSDCIRLMDTAHQAVFPENKTRYKSTLRRMLNKAAQLGKYPLEQIFHRVKLAIFMFINKNIYPSHAVFVSLDGVLREKFQDIPEYFIDKIVTLLQQGVQVGVATSRGETIQQILVDRLLKWGATKENLENLYLYTYTGARGYNAAEGIEDPDGYSIPFKPPHIKELETLIEDSFPSDKPIDILQIKWGWCIYPKPEVELYEYASIITEKLKQYNRTPGSRFIARRSGYGIVIVDRRSNKGEALKHFSNMTGIAKRRIVKIVDKAQRQGNDCEISKGWGSFTVRYAHRFRFLLMSIPKALDLSDTRATEWIFENVRFKSPPRLKKKIKRNIQADKIRMQPAQPVTDLTLEITEIETSE
ncbi:MAG: hypothetical protein ABII23_04145 [bacterium]